MANSSVSATMRQLQPQLDEFCTHSGALTTAVASKGSGFTEDQASKLSKLNISIAVALQDLKTAKAAIAPGGGSRRRRGKARKTRRRN